MDKNVKGILRLSFVALILKMASAPASYVMFVVLAQSMGLEQYGIFAFAFSIATVLGKVAVVGQQQAALAVLPPLDDAGDTHRWRGAIWFGLRLVLLASIVLTLVQIGLAYVWGDSNRNATIAAALLVPLLAFSEFQTSIIRTNGKLFWALAPRELIWRIAVILVAMLSIYNVTPAMSAVDCLTAMSILLLLSLGLQTLSSPVTRYWISLSGEKTIESAAWTSMAKSFWLTTVVTFITPNIAVVLIGLVLDPIQSGPFFAALKTAQLMTLFLLASNIVATPLLSKYWARGDQATVQRVCSTIAVSAGLFSVISLVVIVILGDQLLGFFGAGFEAARPELIVMSVGFAFSALNGPNGALLQMAGRQARFARIVLITGTLSVIVLVPLTVWGGTLGAAWAILFSTVSWNVWGWFECRRELKIDTSILGGIGITK